MASASALVLGLVLVALPVLLGVLVVRVARRMRNGDYPIHHDVINADYDTDG